MRIMTIKTERSGVATFTKLLYGHSSPKATILIVKQLRWFRKPLKKQKLGKSFCKTLFQLRMEVKKGQKQDRDEITQ